METFFSIIVPVYNCERYLERCLESIRQQACQNYEVLLVDDGSTDLSGCICDDYAAKYKQFHSIHKKNGGLSSARNCGLKESRGKYIVFLDSDDFIEKELLLKVYTQLEEKEYDACSFGVRRVDEQGIALYEMRFNNLEQSIVLDDRNRDKFMLTQFLQYKIGWEVCFYVFRRQIIEQERIIFNESLKFAEDIPYTFEYLLHVNKIIKIPDILYNYTYRQGSITSMSETNNIVFAIFSDIYEAIIRKKNLLKEESIFYFAALANYFVPKLMKKMSVTDMQLIIGSKNKEIINRLISKKKDLIRIFGYKEGYELFNLIITINHN